MLTVNTAITVKPQRLVYNEQEYLIAPCVMIVEGVLNGGLVGAAALVPHDWNHVPIVIAHPEDAAGQPISARAPDVLATCGVGHVFHVRLGQGQRAGHPVASLVAELWINLADAQRCGPEAQEAVQMLETQTPLEVSTAFFSDAERQTGSFYGTPFAEVHHNLRPDHLALLPNAIGACSIADGCGAPRLNEDRLHTVALAPACGCPVGESCACHHEEDSMAAALPAASGFGRFVRLLKQFVHEEEATPGVTQHTPDTDPEPQDPEVLEEDEEEDDDEAEDDEHPLVAEKTDVDLRSALYGCLAREMGMDMTPLYIEDLDVTNQAFTYRQGERLRRRFWEMQNGVVVLSPDIQDVQRDTTYVAVPDAHDSQDPQDQQEESPMQNQTVIRSRVNGLIANGAVTGWAERDRPMLEKMDEATLIRLEQQPRAQQAAPPPREPETIAEAIDTLPNHLREPMHAMADEYTRRKNQAIAVLTKNPDCPFPEAELHTMDAQRLEKLVVMGGDTIPGQTLPAPQGNYRGRGTPTIRIVQDEGDTVPPAKDVLGLVVERQRQLGLRS